MMKPGFAPDYYLHPPEIEKMTMADMYLRMLQDAVSQAHGPEAERQERLRQGFPLASSQSASSNVAKALERKPPGSRRVSTIGNVISVDFSSSKKRSTV